ncbi:MAG: hypothetical protein ACHQYP_10080 [Nitrospiria bacterium]
MRQKLVQMLNLHVTGQLSELNITTWIYASLVIFARNCNTGQIETNFL